MEGANLLKHTSVLALPLGLCVGTLPFRAGGVISVFPSDTQFCFLCTMLMSQCLGNNWKQHSGSMQTSARTCVKDL
eukprot:908398-Pelagomonas_calceolata.AAC.3